MQVYIIINKITKSYYIGITNGRKKYYFGSGKALKDAIKKYGRESFRKFTIELCKNRKEASDREKYWIRYAKEKWPDRHCLNLTDGGENEYVMSKEVINRIRYKLIKYYKDHPELKQKYSEHAQNTIVKYCKEHGVANKKINEECRKKILKDYISYRYTGAELAHQYNVSPTTIHTIVKSYLSKGCKGSGNGSTKLKEPDILKIRNEFKHNPLLTFSEVAKKYLVSYQTISRIVNKTTWNHI